MSDNKYEIQRANPTENFKIESAHNIYSFLAKFDRSQVLGIRVPILELRVPYSSEHSSYLDKDFEKNIFARRVGEGNGDTLVIRIEDYPATSRKRNLSDVLSDNKIDLGYIPEFTPEDSINLFGKKQNLNRVRLFHYNEPES